MVAKANQDAPSIAQENFVAMEYICSVLPNGCVVFEENDDEIVLDLGGDSY